MINLMVIFPDIILPELSLRSLCTTMALELNLHIGRLMTRVLKNLPQIPLTTLNMGKQQPGTLMAKKLL